MHITIEVNIKGLEGLASLLQQLGLASTSVQAPILTTPVAAPAVAPIAAPIAAVPAPTVMPTVALATPVPVSSAPVQVAPQPQPVPVATQTYSMDQLAVAATSLMDSGKQNELIALLGQFGVQALTQLPPEQYGNFATQLRALGAKI